MLIRLLVVSALGSLFEAGTAAALRRSARSSPVAKVIDLLQKLSLQVQEEGKREAEQYDKYACFCREQASNKAYAIAKSDEQIEAVAAEIELLTAEIASLDKEAGELDADITKLQGEIQGLADTRSEEHDAYTVADENVTGAIAACQEAIELMRESRKKVKEVSLAQLAGLLDRPDVAAMLSVVAGGSGLSEGVRRAGAGAVRVLQPGAPSKYEYHSKDVIEILQDLLARFKETKQRLYEAEFEKRSIAEKEILGKSNEKKFKEKDKAEKAELSDSKSAQKHDLEAQRDEETKARDADTEFQAVLTTQCEERAAEWDQRSKARADELNVIGEAIGLLESGASAQYSAVRKPVDLHQAHTAASERAPRAAEPRVLARSVLLQLGSPSGAPRGSATPAPQSPGRAAQLAIDSLGAAAKRLGSTALAALAVKASLKEEPKVDHFVKVRGIINDLIQRLEEEAKAEGTQKSVCDESVSAAVKTRDEQQSEVEALGAAISKNEAKIASLHQEIATLSEEIAELNKALNEATELRAQEKTANEKTIKDAAEGKAALDGAMKVLKDFYEPASAALLQKTRYVPPNADREGSTVDDLAPELSSSGEYAGKGDSAGGIMALLEVIQADFQRTVDTVTEAEKEAANKHREFKTQTESDIKAKEDDKEDKEDEITTAEETVTTAKDNQKDAESLHSSALEELEKLQAMCVDGAESYEERAKKREQEIEALKQAMSILENFNQ